MVIETLGTVLGIERTPRPLPLPLALDKLPGADDGLGGGCFFAEDFVGWTLPDKGALPRLDGGGGGGARGALGLTGCSGAPGGMGIS